MAEFQELIFLWHDSDDHAVFITREYYCFLKQYYNARDKSKTFGEFWHALGDYGRGYVKPFIIEDGIPNTDDNLVDLEQEYWILNEPSFPIIQCVEETYTYNSKYMPENYCKGIITTEYGHDIGLFLVSDFVYIKDLMVNNDIIVRTYKSPFPVNIFVNDNGAFIR